MKKTTVFIAILSTVLLVTLILTYAVERDGNPARRVLRLHVVANSNSDYDQALKYAIRDRIVEETRGMFADSNSLAYTKQLASDNLELLRIIAQDEVERNGFDYDIAVSLGTQAFPATVYGDIMFPAGIYDALIITIGESSGENWWCVIFPPLCFIDGVNFEFSTESREMLNDNNGNTVQLRFRILDAFNR